MANDQHEDNEKAPQGKIGLSKETIEEVRNAVLYGVGYKRPPQHTGFKKGQSGNPKGRSKISEPGPDSSRSANTLALREGERLVSIREGEHVRQIPAIEAVYRSQLKSATSGSAYAQKHFIQRYDWAEREQRQKIADDIEFWSQYVKVRRTEIAGAEANGEALPDPLPHPDDIIIDYEKGVRIVGPFSNEGRSLIEESARFRDVLIMQDALDQRMADNASPLEQPGSALVFAHVFNASLPARYQLSEMAWVLRMDDYATWPKRKLLREVYRAW